MSTIKRSLWCTATFVIICSSQFFAQKNDQVIQSTNVQTLRDLALKWRTAQEANLEQAKIRAAEMNLPFVQENTQGGIIEIQGLSANGHLLYHTTDNLEAAQTISTDDVWPGGALGYSLNGSGMTIGEWDGGAVRSTHQELTGRVTQVDAATPIADHPTHVAGTLIGSGVDPSAKGMSFTADLDAYDWNFDNSEMATAASNGLLISNHSYGTITGWRYNDAVPRWEWWGDTTISGAQDYNFGYYDGASQAWDQIARNAPYYLIVKSAGNDRGEGHTGTHFLPQHNAWSTTARPDDGGSLGYDCISTYSGAKNILTIGAVNSIVAGYSGPSSVVMSSFSGWGPTDDGRIKPDVVANGVGVYSSLGTSNTAYASWNGTSMATPSAAGSLLLIQQHYHNENNNYMRAATLKGLVIHTADEAGSSAGPDYKFGWGLMNTAKAVDHISNNTGDKSIIETTLSNAQVYTFNFTSNGLSPIRATVSWTDIAGTPVSASLNPSALMLVNDLDVRIRRNSDNFIFYPYVLNPASPANAATTGDNFRDNVEQVYMANPVAGSYTVVVTNKGSLSGGNQPFSLILDGGNIQAQPLNCLATFSGFPYYQDFETFTTCSTTPASICNLPVASGWQNDTNDDIDWTVYSGSSPSSNTGPSTDFNPGTISGKYLYTEASNTGEGFPFKEAILNSPCYNLDTMVDTELSFAYHMYGGSMGSLSVEVYNGISWTQVWTLSGDRGNAWQLATVDLSAYDGDTIRLRFIGVTGNNFTSDMAIDGIEIRERVPCPDPFNVSIYNITDTTAEFTWTSSAPYWRVGLALAGGPFNVLGTINFNPVTIIGLLPATDYDFYLQDSCGGGDTSNWIGPFHFRTTGPMTNPSLCGENQSIADNTCPNFEIYEMNVSNAPGTAMGYNVYLKQVNLIIDHTYDADLAIALVSPGADSIALSIFNGGSSDNFGNPLDPSCSQYTSFNDNAAISITAGTAPFIGLYRPEDSLTYLNSGSPNGTWKLLICDDFSSDVGHVQYLELAFDTIDVCAHPAISVTNTGSGSFCAGNSTVLKAQGGTNYTWYRNGQPLSGANLDSLVVTQSGKYNVVNTDTANCLDSAAVAVPVTVHPYPNVTMNSSLGTNICQGQTTTLSTVPGIGYQWYRNGQLLGGATNSTLAASTSGRYNVMVTATGNCADSATNGLQLQVNSLPVVTINNSGSSTYCQGLNTNLSTAVSGTYQWYRNGSPISGANGSSYSVTQSGNYNVRVTNVSNCSDSAGTGTAIVVNPKPTASISNLGNATFCQGQSTTLSAGSWSSYQWYKNGSLLSGATSSTLMVTQSGKYNAVVTNSNSCSDSAVSGTVITVHTLPSVILINSGPLTFCNGGSVTLGTITPGTFQWYKNGIMIGSATTSSYVAATSGRYNVVVTNGNSCSDSAATAAQVVVHALPSVSVNAAGPTSFCFGDSVELSTSGGVYQWYRNGQLISGALFNSYIAIQPGNYNVMVTNANNCKDSASTGTSVVVHPLPVVVIQTTQTDFCFGDSAVLSTDPAMGYQWYVNGATLSGQVSQNTTAKISGHYNVLVTDANNCSDSAISGQTIVMHELPVVTLTAFNEICERSDPIVLSGGTPLGGTYAGPGVSSGQFDPGMAGVGTHVITYSFTDTEGCSDTASADIKVNDCTGIDDNQRDRNLVVYPNPSQGLLYLEFSQQWTGTIEIQVLDARGRLVLNKRVDLLQSGQMTLDLSGAERGTYYLVVTAGGAKWNQKIILE